MPFKTQPDFATFQSSVTSTQTGTKTAPMVAENWQVSSSSNAAISVQTGVKESWSVNTPNFASLRKNKQALPVNVFRAQGLKREMGYWSHYAVTRSWNDFQGFVTTRESRNGPTAHVVQGAISGNVTAPLVAVVTSRDDLYLKARTKLKQNAFNAPIFALEGRKTANMILGFARTTILTLADLRKGNLLDAYKRMSSSPLRMRGVRAPTPRELRAFERAHANIHNRMMDRKERERFEATPGNPFSILASNKYLEWKYGWMPFVKDIQDSAIAVEDALSRESTSAVGLSARHEAGLRSQERVLVNGGPDVWAFRESIRKESRRLKISYIPDPLGLGLKSFGLTNPFSVAWDAIPLSFMVDACLFPVGRYLSSLDAGVGCSFRSGGSEGLRIEVTSFLRPDSDAYPSNANPRNSVTVSGSGTAWAVERMPLNDLPAVMPQNITLRPELGASQVITSLALLRQRFKTAEGK